MAGLNTRHTSAKAATAANNVLGKPKSSRAAKSVVGSAIADVKMPHKVAGRERPVRAVHLPLIAGHMAAFSQPQELMWTIPYSPICVAREVEADEPG